MSRIVGVWDPQRCSSTERRFKLGRGGGGPLRFLSYALLALPLFGCESREVSGRIHLDSGHVTDEAIADGARARPSEAAPFRFAFASVLSPERSTVIYSRLAGYLSQRLRRPVDIVRRKTYRELNELLRTGSVHAGIICSGAFAIGQAEFGLRALVLPEIEGRVTYHSYVITRREARFRTLDDMRGAVFAFSDPLSNSGFRYVAGRLRDKDTSPVEFFSRHFFTYSHDNTIEAVRDGIADAGSIDSLVWDHLVRTDPDVVAALRIVEQSPAFPINPVAVAPDMPDEAVEELAEIFLGMAGDPGAADILEDVGVTRFVPVTPWAQAGFEALAASWEELGVIRSPSGTR